MYLRTIKVRSSSGSINEYVRLVEAYRDNGKVKQRTLADLGRKDLLVEILPKLQRFLGGDQPTPVRPKTPTSSTPPPGGRSSPSAACSTNSALWTILDAGSVRPRVCRSRTGRSSWSPIG